MIHTANEVTVLGETLIDVLMSPTGTTVEHVGGSPANVAIGLARLGHRTRLETYLASDARGSRIADLMAAEGVKIGSTRLADRTSTALGRLDAAGIATYEFDLEWRLDPSAVEVGPDSHIHTGSIAGTTQPGADAVLEVIRGHHERVTVSYDPNVRPTIMTSPRRTGPMVERLIALSDVVKASRDDIGWLYGSTPITEVLRHWSAMGPALCVVTSGEDDIFVYSAGEIRRFSIKPTPVVDTVGAGDSFMAGLLSGLLDAGLVGGRESRERLRQADWEPIGTAVDCALTCAAVAVARAGANPPRRAQLGALGLPLAGGES